MRNEGERRILGINVESPRIKAIPFAAMRSFSEIHSLIRNMQIEGGHFPKSGAALVVIGPHLDVTDPLIIMQAVMTDAQRTLRLISIADAVDPDPKKRYIEDLAKVPMPVLRFATDLIVSMCDPIPIQRETIDRAFIETLDENIKKRRLVGLFVEDALKSDNLKNIQSGAAHIALKYPELPVYPVGIVNANRHKGFRNLTVKIGEPFSAEQLIKENPNLTKAELTQYIADRIADLIGIDHPVIARGQE